MDSFDICKRMTQAIHQFVNDLDFDDYVPFNIGFGVENIPFSTAKLLQFAHYLREELVLSIDHYLQLLPDHRPLVPIFFVKGHNFLKEQCSYIGFEDESIDSLPKFMETTMLTKVGPSALDTLPILRHGMLHEPTSDGTIGAEIERFGREIVIYCLNATHATGVFPRLPHSYTMSVLNFRQMFERARTKENFVMVSYIDSYVQRGLNQHFHNVPADLVERQGSIENHHF